MKRQIGSLYFERSGLSEDQKKLAERARSGAKVDKLMQLCDELESTLKQSRADSEKLMTSVINHLTKAA